MHDELRLDPTKLAAPSACVNILFYESSCFVFINLSAIGDGWDAMAASALSRAQALSILFTTSALNSARGKPGGIGSKISTTSGPGERASRRRGQNKPELRANGTQGMWRPS